MTIDVFGADEQADCEVALELAGGALAQASSRPRASATARRSRSLFVDEPTIAELNERFLGQDGPDRRAELPARGRAARVGAPARRGRHRSGRAPRRGAAGAARRRRRLPEGRRVATPCATASTTTTSSRCSSSTGRCTSWAGTTRATRRRPRWRPGARAAPRALVRRRGRDGDRHHGVPHERRRAARRDLRAPLRLGLPRASPRRASLRTTKVRAHSLREDGHSGSRRLERLVENPQAFLNPVLLMVLVCQLVAATLVGVLASRWFGPIGIVIATVAQVVIVFVVFEAMPKNWAVRHTDRAALFAAPVIYAVTRFPPVRWISSHARRARGPAHGRPAPRAARRSPSPSCWRWPTSRTPTTSSSRRSASSSTRSSSSATRSCERSWSRDPTW